MTSKKTKIQVIAQIKKLMRLARSEKEIGNDAASMRCDEKITQLRARHGVTEEILLDDAPDDFDGEAFFLPTSPLFRRRRVFWQELLGGSLAEHFECRTVVFTNSNAQFVVGDHVNRKKTIDAFHDLLKQGIDRAKRITIAPDAARLASQSFLLGFALEIQQRLAGFRFNEQQLARYCHHLPSSPESFAPNPQALVKSERVAITEKSARRERIETQTADLKKTPPPKIKRVDDEAYLAGIEFAHGCAMPDSILAPAMETCEKLQEIEREIIRKREEERKQSRFYWSGADFGSTGYTATVTFHGTQMNFDYD